MKRLLLLLFVLLSIIKVHAQTDDSTKYTWYKFQYGSRMDRYVPDKMLYIPYRDSLEKGFRPGAFIKYIGDNQVYQWENGKWNLFGGLDATKVPLSRTITINGVTQDLSADRTWTITKDDVGLSNVDNTSDLNKPVSVAQQAALDDTAQSIREAIEGIITTVSHDATLTGDGTPGNPLKVDTSGNLIATKSDLDQIAALPVRGVLYSDDFNSTLSNWTETGSGDFNVTSNQLEVSDPAGLNTFTKYLTYTDYGTTDLKPIKIKWRIIVGTVGATSYCPAVGFQTASGSRNMKVSINTTTDANRGRIQWYYDNASPVFRYSDGSITVNTGDTIDCVFELQKDSYTATFINRTSNEGQSVTDWFFMSRTANGNSAGFPISFQTSINALGATVHVIDSFSVSTDAPMRVDYLEVGNSLVHGSLTSNSDNTASNYLNRVVRETFYQYGGPGETVEQVNANDIIALAPRRIIIRLGTNNLIGAGDNAATFMGKLATLVGSLTGAGYVLGSTLFISTLPPTNTNDVSSYNTSIISTYGSQNAVIDLNKTLKAFGGTGISSRYITSDGIHFEDWANKAIANTYITFFGLTKKAYSQPAQWPTIDFDGKLTIGRYHSFPREGFNYSDPTGTMRISNNADSSGGFLISNNNNSVRLAANVTWNGTQYIARMNRGSMTTVDTSQLAWSAKSGLTAGSPITFAATDVKFAVKTNGRMGVNQGTPITALHVEEAGALGIMHVNTLGGSQDAGAFRLQRTGVPSAIGDALGTATFGYNTGVTIRTTAIISALAAQSMTDGSARGTDLTFRVVPNNSTSFLEAMRIKENGFIGIGTTEPIAALDVRTSGTFQGNFQNTSVFSTSSGAFTRFVNSGTPTAADQRIGGNLWVSNPSGTTQRTGASILAYSEDAWTDNTSHPTYLQFNTTASGSTGNTERMRISASGDITVSGLADIGTRLTTASATGVLGSITNGSNGQVMTMVSGSPAWANAPTSGTYTPTVSGLTNVTSNTPQNATWMRVGNTVTVAGAIDIGTASIGTVFSLFLSLPIASDFTGYDGGGTGGYALGTNCYTLTTNVANDVMQLQGTSENTGMTITYHFSYTIK